MTHEEFQPPRFEPLREEHIRQLLPIEREAYPDPWTYGMFFQETESRVAHFFVMYAGESIAGYGGFWFVVDEAHITKVTVEKSRRGQGYGRNLMDFLLAWARMKGAATVRLEVRESNLTAQALYERLGFTKLGIRERYYASTGENALVMLKEIAAPGGND